MQPLIGIFGGTFDPVHLGHTQAVKLLCETLEFTRLHWVVSARPPHKQSTSASPEHRLAMLRLALPEQSNFVIDDRELRRTGKSYTFDTVQTFRVEYPEAVICLIVGMDSFLQFESWYRSEELLDQIQLVVLHRPGYSGPVPASLKHRLVAKLTDLQQHPAGKIALFEHSHFAISATEIRALLGSPAPQELPAAYETLLDPAVIDYIKQNKLYSTNTMNPTQLKDQIVAALEDVKAQEIKVIDIADISDFADYMIVASGTSDTHVKALARESSDRLRRQGVKPLNEDGADIGEWVLVDFGDVVLHVMRPEVRAYYDLEKLWDEDVRELLKAHRENQGT